MPEGPTLHTLARDLENAFAGTLPAASSPQGRFADGAALLDGREVLGAHARGKHVFVEFDGGTWLQVHLGLIGTFTVTEVDGDGPPEPRGAVRLRLATDDRVADLRGPIVCAVVTPEEVDAVAARLGPDPLRPDEGAGTGWERVARTSRRVAEVLMDQKVVAGVGNVYRSEVLFRHRVDPRVEGRRVRPATWQALWDDLVALMPLAVAARQIVTMDDQVAEVEDALAAGREVSLGERRYHVYRRAGQPCRVCGSRVRTEVVAGRNLFWCGRCQRRH